MTDSDPGQVPSRSELLDLAYRELADGRWHDYEQLVRTMSGLVPPGQAIRNAEATRVGLIRRRAAARGQPLPAGYEPLRQRRASREELIRAGSRNIVRKALNGSRLEVDPAGHIGADQDKRIRDPLGGP